MSALPRAAPESQGIPSAAIRAFLAEAVTPTQELHSFLLMRHGHVVAEAWWHPFSANRPHVLWSLSKSFCSTAVGFAVAEGLVGLDDRMVDLYSGKLPGHVSELLSRMRLRHVLSMSGGHDVAPDRVLIGESSPDWPAEFMAHPVDHEPGTHFVYNSLGTYMAGRIVQERVGRKLTEYLTPRLFEPLGMPTPHWDTCPEGFEVGGWGMSARTEDIAKFGLLYLNGGRWDGEQVLPQGWAEEATRFHVQNGWEMTDWAQGYGFQFWRCQHGAYRGDGAFGQYCVVMPDQDALLAITSCCDDLQAVLTAVWTHLLPAFGSEPLPEGDPLELSALSVPPVEGTARGSDIHSGRFRLDAMPNGFGEVDIRFGTDADTLVWSGPEATMRLVAGRDGWRNTESNGVALAASGGWLEPSLYRIELRHLGGPYQERMDFRFDEQGFQCERRARGAFAPADPAVFSGVRQPIST